MSADSLIFFPGKKNKLKLGQRVWVKFETVKWHATHLCFCFSEPSKDLPNEGEISEESIEDVYLRVRAFLLGKSLKGTVTHYGAPDNDKNIDRKNVFVVIEHDTELGKREDGFYIEEKHLKPIKKKKK